MTEHRPANELEGSIADELAGVVERRAPGQRFVLVFGEFKPAGALTFITSTEDADVPNAAIALAVACLDMADRDALFWARFEETLYLLQEAKKATAARAKAAYEPSGD